MKTNIIFIHGFAFNQKVWDSIIPHIDTDRYNIRFFNIPGFNSKRESPEPFTRLSSQLYKKCIDINEKIILVGHSMGGYIASQMLSNHTDLKAQLLLLNSHPMEDTLEKKERRNKHIQFIAKYGAEKFLTQFYKNLDKNNCDEWNSRYGIGMRDEVLCHYLLEMRNRASSSRIFFNNDIVAHFILGDDDPILEAETVLSASLAADCVNFHIYKGRHMSILEIPNLIVETIEEASYSVK